VVSCEAIWQWRVKFWTVYASVTKERK
jgi:hypothetical protein